MKIIIICTLFFIGLLSCQNDSTSLEFLRSPDSTQVEPDMDSTTEVGSDNSTSSNSQKEISLTSTRLYNPDFIASDSYKVEEQETFFVPTSVIINNGNAAQGWLVLDLDEIRLCYKGAAKKINITSTEFVLKHSAQDVHTSCSAIDGIKLNPEIEYELFRDDVIILRLEGGGCAARCKTTEVTLTLTR